MIRHLLEALWYRWTRFHVAYIQGRDIHTRKNLEYEDYLLLQRKKTLDPVRRSLWLGAEWQKKVEIFEKYFAQEFVDHGLPSRALCVGARTGQEVQALRNLGVDAIGVDLVPELPLVLEGDMHALPWGHSEFDYVFSNCFDHSLRPDVFVSELERVSAPGGLIDLHLQMNKRDDEFGVTDVFHPRAVENLFSVSTVIQSGPMDELLAMNFKILSRRV